MPSMEYLHEITPPVDKKMGEKNISYLEQFNIWSTRGH